MQGMSVRGRVRVVGGDGRAEGGRRRLGFRLGVAFTSASLVVALAACGSDNSSSGSSATTASSGGATTTAGSSAATSAPAKGDGSTIKIGWLGPQSGALASTFAPALTGVQTYVKYWNDQGGLNGHKLDLSVYDTQSNSSAVLASARKAVGDGVQALISNDVY